LLHQPEENKESNMTLAIALNAVLAVIVLIAVIAPLARAIRTSAAEVVTPAAPRPQPARSRRRSGGLVPARPWA
jgi:hypothetical protein